MEFDYVEFLGLGLNFRDGGELNYVKYLVYFCLILVWFWDSEDSMRFSSIGLFGNSFLGSKVFVYIVIGIRKDV